MNDYPMVVDGSNAMHYLNFTDKSLAPISVAFSTQPLTAVKLINSVNDISFREFFTRVNPNLEYDLNVWVTITDTGLSKEEEEKRIKKYTAKYPTQYNLDRKRKAIAAHKPKNPNPTPLSYPIDIEKIPKESLPIHVMKPYRHTWSFPLTITNKKLGWASRVEEVDMSTHNPFWSFLSTCTAKKIQPTLNEFISHMVVDYIVAFIDFFVLENSPEDILSMMCVGWPFLSANVDDMNCIQTTIHSDHGEVECYTRNTLCHYLLPNGQISVVLMRNDLKKYEELDECISNRLEKEDVNVSLLSRLTNQMGGLWPSEHYYVNYLFNHPHTTADEKDEDLIKVSCEMIQMFIRLRQHLLKHLLFYMEKQTQTQLGDISQLREFRMDEIDVKNWKENVALLRQLTYNNQLHHTSAKNRRGWELLQ